MGHGGMYILYRAGNLSNLISGLGDSLYGVTPLSNVQIRSETRYI